MIATTAAISIEAKSYFTATSLRRRTPSIVAIATLSLLITPTWLCADDTALTSISASGVNRVSDDSAHEAAIKLNEQAVQLIFEGKAEAGRKKIVEALAHDPSNPTVLYNYAGICLTEGKAKEAVEAMEKAVKRDPKDLALLNRLAEAYFADSNLEFAVKNYERIVAVDPKFEQALFRLGTLYGMQQKWEESETTLRRAHEANKQDVKILTNLGSVLVLREKFRDAIEVLEIAKSKQPSNAEVEMSLGIAQEGLKANDKALQHYTEAKRLGLKDEGLEKRISELQKDNSK